MTSALFTSMTAMAADELQISTIQPTQIAFSANNTTGNTYIIQLVEPAIAVYEGGIEGFEATSANARRQKNINNTSRTNNKEYSKRPGGNLIET